MTTPSADLEPLYHVTVVSNFARAFDKYSRRYDKRHLPRSTFADQFFLLQAHELAVGIAKAQRLLSRLALPGDRLLVLQTRVARSALRADHASGLGRYVAASGIDIEEVHWLDESGKLVLCCVEEAYAASLACLGAALRPYAELVPRSLSVLPIARACQAKCLFCYSEASASLEQRKRLADLDLAQRWMAPAARAGAQRLVITGGGEPGLLEHASLTALMAAGARHFPKVVLITNGMHLALQPSERRVQMLRDYAGAGLSVLALSRHHPTAEGNRAIMGVDTQTPALLQTLRQHRAELRTLRLRLICVLQKGGVDSTEAVAQYLAWARAQGVDEVCFKELYVSSTLESAYSGHAENEWSRANQVPLAMLRRTLLEQGYDQVDALPWGAPVFQRPGDRLRVAAYTEPSVYWERANGIARSWNLMADGSCLASLEDPGSTLALRDDAPASPSPRRVIPVQPA